jgi:hypothetical protein
MDDDERIVTVPGTGKTMAMAWALALVLQCQNGGPLEPPCPFEPRRRGTACH